jgi:hypothetical protein
MRSSQTISLFSERPEVSQRPSTFLVSMLMHGAVIGLLYAGIKYGPKMNNRVVTERMAVRHLDLNPLETPLRKEGDSGIEYPGPRAAPHKAKPGSNPSEQQQVLAQVANATPAHQIIVQPDLPPTPPPPQEIPVPSVVIWQPAKTTPTTIVAPPPEKPVAAEMKPMLVRPNEAERIADVSITPTELPSQRQPILASTTSPVVVHGPEVAQKPPETTTVSPAPPTPAAIVSISDLHVQKGTVTLPPVNEAPQAANAGIPAPGQKQAKDAPHPAPPSPPHPQSVAVKTAPSQSAGQGVDKSASESKAPTPAKLAAAPASTTAKAGTGQGAAEVKGPPKPVVVAGNSNAPSTRTEPAPGAQEGSNTGDQPGTHHIALPKDGQFGSVVVGVSLTDKYPESAEVWGGRMAYTVYLHVGQAKSWILQYSLPRSEESAQSGSLARLEAPWPYNEIVPTIAPGTLDADALMVHGFVTAAGHFETLAVVFPTDFPQAQFVLDALKQWQFRPATQGGQIAKVEVLLIIPDIE